MAMIRCKECGKEISDQAVACPHCGRVHYSGNTVQQANDELYISGWVILLCIFCCCPIGVILMWVAKKPNSMIARIIITTVIGLYLLGGTAMAIVGDSDTSTETADVETEVTTEVVTEKQTETTTEKSKESQKKEKKKTTKKKTTTEKPTEAKTEEPTTEENPAEIEQKFKEDCLEIWYKDLIRYSDDYVGQHVMVALKIEQTGISGGLFSSTEYIRGSTYYIDELGNTSTLDGDTYCLVDKRDYDKSKILVDDYVIVYGIFQGTKKFKSVLGENIECPLIDIKYLELLSE